MPETKTQRRVRFVKYVLIALFFLLWAFIGIFLFKLGVRWALPSTVPGQLAIAQLQDDVSNHNARVEELEKVVALHRVQIRDLQVSDEITVEQVNPLAKGFVMLFEDLDILRGQLLALREQLETHTHDQHLPDGAVDLDPSSHPRNGCR